MSLPRALAVLSLMGLLLAACAAPDKTPSGEPVETTAATQLPSATVSAPHSATQSPSPAPPHAGRPPCERCHIKWPPSPPIRSRGKCRSRVSRRWARSPVRNPSVGPCRSWCRTWSSAAERVRPACPAVPARRISAINRV